MFPRLRSIPNEAILEANVKATLPVPSERGVLLRLTETPDPLHTLRLAKYVAKNAARVAVEVGPRVGLRTVGELEALQFVILAPGRKHLDDLEALPRSLIRLSIGKSTKPLPLGALAALRKLEELQVDTPGALGGIAPLPALSTLAWINATDQANDFIALQQKLLVLGLHSATLSRLPAVPSLQRLLLFYPRNLPSLVGIERMPALRALRIDQPSQMKRLGSLAKLTQLETITLLRAHAIASLADLATVPNPLEVLHVALSKLDARPFAGMKGRVKGAFFHLQNRTVSANALAHLGVPERQVDTHEPTLFDQ